MAATSEQPVTRLPLSSPASDSPSSRTVKPSVPLGSLSPVAKDQIANSPVSAVADRTNTNNTLQAVPLQHHPDPPPLPTPPIVHGSDRRQSIETLRDTSTQKPLAGATNVANSDPQAGCVADTAPSSVQEDTWDWDDEQGIHERDPAKMASWTGRPAIKGQSEVTRMVLLSFAWIGISFTWGVEMTYCTPYLLSLGLTKSNTSLVWVAGPLSGLIVQPIVGAIADESTSRWGRRRPLMVLGAAIVALSLVALGFTKEIVALVVHDQEAAKQPAIVLAVLAIYVLDFAINAIMSCARSLIVDTLPIEKQQAGAAWSSRMASVGHVLGYGAGALDLVSIFGTSIGSSQFQHLAVISLFVLLLSIYVTCWAVTERVLVTPASTKGSGSFKALRQIWHRVYHLPPRIQAICWAQFWSWIGWFPFMFYSTTWVGETYFRYDVPSDTMSKDVLGDIGRIGSISLVIYSSITFAGAFILPLLVKSPDEQAYTPRAPPALARFLGKVADKRPDLLSTWIYGHLIFSASMAFAPFATSFRFATILVAVCGIPWTIALWAPTALLGVEVNKMSGASEHGSSYHRLSSAAAERPIELFDVSHTEANLDDGDEEASTRALHLELSPDNDGGTASTGELSGVYFGILNIYTTLPQFVGTFISTIVFAILEPGKSPELADEADSGQPSDVRGPNAIAVCLFIGAMSTLGAAWATRKLKQM